VCGAVVAQKIQQGLGLATLGSQMDVGDEDTSAVGGFEHAWGISRGADIGKSQNVTCFHGDYRMLGTKKSSPKSVGDKNPPLTVIILS
jgi:hypothetical protein